MSCTVGTIRQIHRQLIQEGFCISEYALRKWIKDGRVQAVYSGRRAYISYQQVVDLLLSAVA